MTRDTRPSAGAAETELRTEARRCDEQTVPTLRRWTVAALTRALPDARAGGRLIDDAQLIVSELVTNGVRAGCRHIQLRLLLRRTEVVIEVDEDAPGRPQLAARHATDEHGRGLVLVAALSRKWGVRERRAGKTVWAILPWSPGVGAAGAY